MELAFTFFYMNKFGGVFCVFLKTATCYLEAV